MRFQDPGVLLLIPLLLFLLWIGARRRRPAVTFSNTSALKRSRLTLRIAARKGLVLLRTLVLVIFLAALARPQKGDERTKVTTEGIAMEMAVDVSGSMRALDFQEGGNRKNRLDVVKEVFRDFVVGGGDLPGRPNDLIGIVAFGGFADSKCPLTLDHGALLQVLETVDIPKEIFDGAGRLMNSEEFQTAVGDALALATERLKNVEAKSKVLILLTDGESNFGTLTPEEGAEIARAFGIKVYTIGVGSTGIVPVQGKDHFGNPILQRMRVRIDEDTLKKIAEVTEGRYFHARNPDSLKEIYQEIDRLEKTKTEVDRYMDYRELFPALVIAGLCLLVLEALLNNTWLLRIP